MTPISCKQYFQKYYQENYYGWNYCVVRDGAKVTEGDVVSASVLEVEKGDSVYWAFGTMAQANEYFATRVANN